MGAHLIGLSESFPMNTNMAGFKRFSKNVLRSCAFDKSSLSIERVNEFDLWPAVGLDNPAVIPHKSYLLAVSRRNHLGREKRAALRWQEVELIINSLVALSDLQSRVYSGFMWIYLADLSIAYQC